MEKRYEGKPGKFIFKTDERPINFPIIEKREKEKRAKELQFNNKYHKPIPNYKEKEAEVKLNTAAILREEHLVMKKEEEERKKLVAYEIELHDASEFNHWQNKMKEKDKFEQMQLMQKSNST